MKNYLMLNGQKIELTEKQISEMERIFGASKVKLEDVPVGKTFKIGEYEFVVLEHSKDTTSIIFKDLLKRNETFGGCNNNFNDSNADRICCEFAEEIGNIIGLENITVHTVDLTSDDGLKCYGTVERRMSLLTAEQYRRYVEILDKHKLDKWWWLATAYSTPNHNDDDWVNCVAPSGVVYYVNYYSLISGVRPFCILKSNIFVSK